MLRFFFQIILLFPYRKVYPFALFSIPEVKSSKFAKYSDFTTDASSLTELPIRIIYKTNTRKQKMVSKQTKPFSLINFLALPFHTYTLPNLLYLRYDVLYRKFPSYTPPLIAKLLKYFEYTSLYESKRVIN